MSDIIIRGATGNPEDVVINGNYDVTTNRCFYLTSNVVISALTISNGYARLDDRGGDGGGILVEPLGTAMGVGVVISNCMILDCTAERNGGGARLIKGIITETIIACNTASNYGGGMGLYNSGTISRSIFSNNNSKSLGGGLYANPNPGPGLIYDCRFIENNSGAAAGGGIYLNGAPGAVVSNCFITDNQNSKEGAGVYITGAASSQAFYNCLINGNNANSYAGVYQFSGTSFWHNCTIAGNQAASDTGGMGWRSAVGNVGKLVNSIVYGNTAPVNSNYFKGGSAVLNADYNCAAPSLDGYGVGNVSFDPVFLTDYHLSNGSSCINIGTNLEWMAGAFDLDGRARIDRFSGKVDMGCYENVPQGMLFHMR